jgi:hypothetical protein
VVPNYVLPHLHCPAHQHNELVTKTT